MKKNIFFLACIGFAGISNTSARPAANVLQRLVAGATEYWKLKKTDSNTKHKFVAAGLFGFGWLKKDEAVKEVSPELEKEVLQKIATITSEDFTTLHEYAKKYSSHAPIRNALMQKSVSVAETEQITDEQKALIIKLVDYMDSACDPHGVISWVIGVEKEIAKIENTAGAVIILGSNHFSPIGFRASLAKRSILKKAIHAIASAGETISWKTCNKLCLYKEMRDAAYAKISALQGADTLECIAECADLIASDGRIHEYLVKELITHKGAMQKADPTLYSKLFSQRIGESIWNRVIAADDINSALWFTENFPEALICLHKICEYSMDKFFDTHYYKFSSSLKRAFFTNKNMLQREIGSLLLHQNASNMLYWKGLGLDLLSLRFTIFWENRATILSNLSIVDDWRQRILCKLLVDSKRIHDLNAHELNLLARGIRPHIFARHIFPVLLKKLDDNDSQKCVHSNKMCADCAATSKEFQKDIFRLLMNVIGHGPVRDEDYAKIMADFYRNNLPGLRDIKLGLVILFYANHLDMPAKQEFHAALCKYIDERQGTPEEVVLTSAEYDLLLNLVKL